MHGILVINKEKGYTSRDVVNRVSKKLGTKKIGHTGTLDPIATGVLVLCVGEATKLVEILMDHDKEYIAGVTLGIETDTLDCTGNVLKKEEVFKTKEEIKKVLKTFIGTYEQEVPAYSAVKVKGKKLYEYARKGKEVSLPKKLVTIFSLELLDKLEICDGHISFTIKTTVSKGTYIRSLIRDIAKKLGTVGMMTSLIRTRVGDYTLESAIDIDDVNETSLLPMLSSLDRFPHIIVNENLEKKIRNGVPVENKYQKNSIVFLNSKQRLLAIYKKNEKNEKMLKPWKVFVFDNQN